MAYTDALTSLANRLAFRETLDERLLQMQGAGRQLALLFADIDDFKRVNDTLGHDAGDEVLLQFAQRIRDASSASAATARRWRVSVGDEFVILVSRTRKRARCARVASRWPRRLVNELGQPITVHGRQVFLGTSIGITLFPQDASGANALMKNGDIAMYQAKVAGKNCYRFYSRAMDQAVERRVHLEHELRRRVGPRRTEPGLPAGLPRLRQHPARARSAAALAASEHGVIAPSVFIDVAEQSGLIETLGPQVLRAACEDAVRWPRTACGAIRCSCRSTSRRASCAAATCRTSWPRCCATPDLHPKHLHLELTETAGARRRDAGQRDAVAAARAGVQVWLDDFGTGFSGLSHLRRVPIDGVKIDRELRRRHPARSRRSRADHRDHRDGALARDHRHRRRRGA
jgi:diguanylate cyclase (GGDEF)-like protein